ncbi:MAG: hypothetical protein Q7N87_04935 [Candidatus Uhrbacteria bacterium]|nr:hypothetical protein [Candidatus Uhrbacteria bacterium]MDP3793265.1 hypothetical protein [Candidatus Uhrbacteria bacterium]
MWNALISLVRPSLWFNPYPVPFLPYTSLAILVLMCGLLVLWVLCTILIYLGRHSKTFATRWGLDKETRRLLDRWGWYFLWAGIVGLFLRWCTEARVPLFGMHFLLILWFLGFGWWMFVMIREQIRSRASRVDERKRQAYERWLPKAKKS